jgi:tetratricopeptide (TPR) repeat protein
MDFTERSRRFQAAQDAFQRGDVEGARALFDALVGDDPGYGLAWVWLGHVHERRRDRAAAEAAFGGAIAAEPRAPMAYFFRGRVRAADGRDDDAIADLTEAERLEDADQGMFEFGMSELFLYRAAAHERKGMFDEAIRDHWRYGDVSFSPTNYDVQKARLLAKKAAAGGG